MKPDILVYFTDTFGALVINTQESFGNYSKLAKNKIKCSYEHRVGTASFSDCRHFVLKNTRIIYVKLYHYIRKTTLNILYFQNGGNLICLMSNISKRNGFSFNEKQNYIFFPSL